MDELQSLSLGSFSPIFYASPKNILSLIIMPFPRLPISQDQSLTEASLSHNISLPRLSLYSWPDLSRWKHWYNGSLAWSWRPWTTKFDPREMQREDSYSAHLFWWDVWQSLGRQECECRALFSRGLFPLWFHVLVCTSWFSAFYSVNGSVNNTCTTIEAATRLFF